MFSLNILYKVLSVFSNSKATTFVCSFSTICFIFSVMPSQESTFDSHYITLLGRTSMLCWTLPIYCCIFWLSLRLFYFSFSRLSLTSIICVLVWSNISRMEFLLASIWSLKFSTFMSLVLKSYILFLIADIYAFISSTISTLALLFSMVRPNILSAMSSNIVLPVSESCL